MSKDDSISNKNCIVFIQLFESEPFHISKMSLIFVVSLWFVEKWSKQNYLLHGNMRAVKLSCPLLLFAFEVIIWEQLHFQLM